VSGLRIRIQSIDETPRPFRLESDAAWWDAMRDAFGAHDVERVEPFAAEVDAPHYDLGRVGTDPGVVLANYRTFRRWVDETLDPAARARGVTSCEMCHRHLSELSPPTYAR